MNEETENNEETVYRYVVLVDGVLHSKAEWMEGAIYSAQEIGGVTNDPIEIHTIH